MIPVTCVTSPPRNVFTPAPMFPSTPIEKTLLPITRSPGRIPLSCRQYISFPDRPVMTAMDGSFPESAVDATRDVIRGKTANPKYRHASPRRNGVQRRGERSPLHSALAQVKSRERERVGFAARQTAP